MPWTSRPDQLTSTRTPARTQPADRPVAPHAEVVLNLWTLFVLDVNFGFLWHYRVIDFDIIAKDSPNLFKRPLVRLDQHRCQLLNWVGKRMLAWSAR